ncbi:hypothetical protein CERSUDRAFT_100168 [Gelatoporia subvermispora B]|uniref:Ribonuclease H1 N-terminal domain-containing protein n=1 Tax=Ceriporiopsis subvermispora (strain B) TaxID=914234 RepID=M2R0C2_CERS8|nr:hypothetical protein CERSUDRAFT_100168 [Gelatoporia subvermispora B]
MSGGMQPRAVPLEMSDAGSNAGDVGLGLPAPNVLEGLGGGMSAGSADALAASLGNALALVFNKHRQGVSAAPPAESSPSPCLTSRPPSPTMPQSGWMYNNIFQDGAKGTEPEPDQPAFKGKQDWYLVTRGRETGVFQGWETVAPYVCGVSGFSCQKVPSEAVGLARYHRAVEAGHVQKVT